MFYTLRETDVANGPGVRVTLFVSGCRLNCKNCFNKEAQNFKYGKEFTDETLNHILELLSKEWISGLSILGGDPFEPENQETVLKLVLAVRERFKNKKTIWVWTGRVYPDDFTIGSSIYLQNGITKSLLNEIDILIDGPFIQDLFDRKLKYRGSSNQKIINLKQT